MNHVIALFEKIATQNPTMFQPHRPEHGPMSLTVHGLSIYPRMPSHVFVSLVVDATHGDLAALYTLSYFYKAGVGVDVDMKIAEALSFASICEPTRMPISELFDRLDRDADLVAASSYIFAPISRPLTTYVSRKLYETEPTSISQFLCVVVPTAPKSIVYAHYEDNKLVDACATGLDFIELDSLRFPELGLGIGSYVVEFYTDLDGQEVCESDIGRASALKGDYSTYQNKLDSFHRLIKSYHDSIESAKSAIAENFATLLGQFKTNRSKIKAFLELNEKQLSKDVLSKYRVRLARLTQRVEDIESGNEEQAVLSSIKHTEGLIAKAESDLLDYQNQNKHYGFTLKPYLVLDNVNLNVDVETVKRISDFDVYVIKPEDFNGVQHIAESHYEPRTAITLRRLSLKSNRVITYCP